MSARPDLHIRRAEKRDYSLFARLFPALEIDDPVPGRDAFARDILPLAVIADLDGEGVGYASGRLLADAGHLLHIIVDERARKRGVGRALMEEMARRFRDAGKKRWCLNVKPDNESAIRLYRRMGMEPAYASSVLRFDWREAESWPIPPLELERAVPGAEDDEAVEAALDLSPGLLATRRGTGDYVLAGLRENGAWVGCAAYSPGHPGAFPFRVARPELAVPLLSSLAGHARSEQMQVVLEDAVETRDKLLSLGAREVMQILHLRGELPGLAG